VHFARAPAGKSAIVTIGALQRVGRMTMTGLRNTRDSYGGVAMAFHWVTVALIVAVYATMEWMEFVPKGDPFRDTLRDLHRSFGLVVFLLVWLRLIWRLIDTEPAIDPLPPQWQALAGRFVHYALYLLMILLPISGYLMSNAAGKTVMLFGAPLPMLIAANKPLASEIKEVHEAIGNLGYLLIGVHAAAALFHHYVQRDTTLKRMLPTGR
jgi:cytochrome b561